MEISFENFVRDDTNTPIIKYLNQCWIQNTGP